MAEFKIGDLVWAKMKGFQPWPGKVIEPKPEVKRPSDKKPKQFVFFFGSANYAWITEDVIWPYAEYRDKYKTVQRPSRVFQEGVETADELYYEMLSLEKPSAASPPPSPPAAAEPTDPPTLLDRSGRRSSSSSEDADKTKRQSGAKKTKTSSVLRAGNKSPSLPDEPFEFSSSRDSNAADARSVSSVGSGSVERKKSAPRQTTSVKKSRKSLKSDEGGKPVYKRSKESGSEMVKRRKRASDTVESSATAAKTSRPLDTSLSASYDIDEPSSSLASRVCELEKRSLLSDSPYLPPDVLPSICDTFVSKKIIATPMKIGFLGLGLIGSGMVDSLLRSGHEVTVWNRTASKCREYMKEGALKGSSPSDVVQSCDITFVCVSDASALKDLVFGNSGVLQGITQTKGFVNMSSVDVETATDVSEAVVTRGGRFLEAPVLGTKQLAKDGQLVLIAAGDRSLYDDCQSCFQAMARHIFYIGSLGSATKMKLVLNLLMGTMLAGLAETMALAEKIGLNTAEVLNILSHTMGNSALLRMKGTDMALSKISEPSCKLQTLQKDLRLAINMSDAVDQPLHVGAAVNELFKKAKAKGYGDYDIAAVYRAADL